MNHSPNGLRRLHPQSNANAEDRCINPSPTAFSRINKIEFSNLIPEAPPQLVIEASSGGAGAAGSTLEVFDLHQGKFEHLLNQAASMEYMDEDGYTQVLDRDRTRQTNGAQFCTTKTTYFSKGKWFPKPQITHPCHPKGAGVNPQIDKANSASLAPLK